MAHGIPCANCGAQEADHCGSFEDMDDLSQKEFIEEHPNFLDCPEYDPDPEACRIAAKHPGTSQMVRWLEERGYKTGYDLDEIAMAECRRGSLPR